MIERRLHIGRWEIIFLFADEEYDVDLVLSRLAETDAPDFIFDDAEFLMDFCAYNCGFTYSNPVNKQMVVMIGPTTSGEEFLNTLTHEIRHVADAIADNLGVQLDSEEPAYKSGDAMMELADVVCRLGCSMCNR